MEHAQQPDDVFLCMDATLGGGERDRLAKDQAAIDQVLALVADHERELSANLGQPAAVTPSNALRESPLGRDLRFLVAVGEGLQDATATDVQERSNRILALLLRPLAASDYDIPEWFWTTTLGRLLATARYQTHPADDLVCAASAAERLSVDEATIDHLLHDGIITAIRDDIGRPRLSLRSLERLRLVAAELHDDRWLLDNLSIEDQPVA